MEGTNWRGLCEKGMMIFVIMHIYTTAGTVVGTTNLLGCSNSQTPSKSAMVILSPVKYGVSFNHKFSMSSSVPFILFLNSATLASFGGSPFNRGIRY